MAAVAVAGAFTVCEDGRATDAVGSVVLAYQHDLRTQTADGTSDRERLQRLHQLRNADAMVELVSALPPAHRPSRILYPAAGSHLAPLALCELLPAETPCTLVLTEIDPSVSSEISALLNEFARNGLVSNLEDDGDRSWDFQLAGRPVRIDLTLVDGESLIEAALLDGIDLVINHDWSGDPLGNLLVIHELLLAVQPIDDQLPPALMIEDLERHPYPIDLTLFMPVARTSLPYGHRDSERGSGLHGDIELGQPLFGGGVVLDFSDAWWRDVDRETLDGVFDLLLFSEFDTERQNVLVGGDDPLLAPALLDWYSAYGLRTTAGGNLDNTPGGRSEIMVAAARALPAMKPELRRILSCRLQLYRCLLQARAAGADIRKDMPSADSSRVAVPDGLPTETMEAMYREALRHVGDYRRSKEAERQAAKDALAVLRDPRVQRALSACPIPEPGSDDDPVAFWRAQYQRLAADLARE